MEVGTGGEVQVRTGTGVGDAVTVAAGVEVGRKVAVGGGGGTVLVTEGVQVTVGRAEGVAVTAGLLTGSEPHPSAVSSNTHSVHCSICLRVISDLFVCHALLLQSYPKRVAHLLDRLKPGHRIQFRGACDDELYLRRYVRSQGPHRW